MTAHRLNQANLWTYSLLLAALFVAHTPLSTVAYPIQFAAALIIIFFLSGANVIHIVQSLFRRTYDPWVYAGLSVLASALLIPRLVLEIYLRTEFISIHTILAVYLALALLPLLWPLAQARLARWLPSLPEKRRPSAAQSAGKSMAFGMWIKHPVTIMAVVILVVHVFNLGQYSFLPVPDSYSWLITFEGQLPHNQLPIDAASERGSFSAFIAAIFYLADIDLAILFKYLLPLISLLSLIPLWLIARELKTRALQLTMLSAAFISPTIILEFEFVRQQVFFLLYLYFLVGFQLYGFLRQDNSILYLTGLFSLVGALTHPAFLITTLTWIIAFAASHVPLFWKYKLRTIIVVLLALPWLEPLRVSNMFVRIYEQARASFHSFLVGQWNLRFPSYFINSDGYEMSWPGLIGVSKYYGFYIGPLVAIVIAGSLVLLASRPFRRSVLAFITSKHLMPVTVPLLLFLLIAEVAPRFGNIAFLPDRAWQYAAILFIAPLYFILAHLESNRPRAISAIAGILVAGVATTVGAAAYINSLTQYTMPDYEFRAAAWMRDNLPPGSTVFSSSSKNIIRYHGEAQFRGFGVEQYVSDKTADILDDIAPRLDVPTPVSSNLHQILSRLSDIHGLTNSLKNDLERSRRFTDGTFIVIDDRISQIQNASAQIATTNKELLSLHNQNKLSAGHSMPPLYIYYARTHDKNPYAARPYESSFTADLDISAFAALDNDDRTFERVYEEGGQVIIWRIKTENLEQL